MKKAALIVCSLLSFSTALAQSEGRTAYDFLRLPVSAHAAALGGDNITLIEDDAALIFNSPALLSSVSDKTIGLNYMNYMSGAHTASATFSRTAGERASWAASAQYLDYGKMKEVDENNVITGEFSARDIAVGGYFSYMLTDYLAGGIAAKMILSYIGDYHSVGFGVDLALNYYLPDTEWSMSAVVRNLGGQLKAYDENFEKMPVDVQIGVSKRFTGTPLRLHATLVDLNHLNYKFADHWVLGADMLLTESFWIGGGYNFRRAHEMRIASSDGKKSSHGAGLSLGAGLNLSRLKINVAYGKYHVSSSSVVLSLGYSL